MRTTLVRISLLASLFLLYAAPVFAKVDAVSIGTQSSTNLPGGSASYAVTATGAGNDSVTFSITSVLPTGAAASFTSNPVNGIGTWTNRLTITSTASTPAGAHPFTIQASSVHGPQTNTGLLVVAGSSTTTAISSSANPETYGQPVTFTASVTSTAAGTPAGTVSFSDGATVLGTAALNGSGQATLTVNGLTVASSPHAIKAAYAGNASFAPSTSSSLSQVINQATLTFSGITASSKTYDGTLSATLDTSSAILGGVLSGDDVQLSGGTATFVDKQAGTDKPVSVSGLTLTGAQSANYALASTTAATTANITPRTLIVSATGVDKVYDGTTDATVTLSDNRVAGDTFSESYTTASFASRNAGPANAVSVSGIALTGDDAANYTHNTTAATQASISARGLTVTAVTDTKLYDGTTSSTGSPTLGGAGLVSGDTAAFTQSFDNKNVGAAKTLTPAGTVTDGNDGLNYNVSLVNVDTGEITPASITVTADNQERAYGQTNPVFTVTYSGFINGDTSSVLSGEPTVSSVAETNSPVDGSPYPITVSAGTLTAANYTFNFAGAELTVTQAVLTVTADSLSNAYGEEVPALTFQYTGFVNDEDSSVISGAPELTTSATAASVVADSPYNIVVTLGTLAADNYSFALVDGQLSVTPIVITPSVTVSGKVYDGTTDALITALNLAAGVISGEDVQLSGGTATFADKQAGPDKPVNVSGLTLTGAQAANYALASTTATTTANITPRTLVVSATGVDKVYDGTTDATVSLSDNRVAGDTFSESYTTASFASRNAGQCRQRQRYRLNRRRRGQLHPQHNRRYPGEHYRARTYSNRSQ
jgi:hypothetical protein